MALPSVDPGRVASGPAALPEASVAAYLSAMARQQPDALAVIVQQGHGGYQRCTFQQLDRASDELAAGLVRAGIARGRRAALMVNPGVEFVTLAFALFKAGAVPVLIDPGLGIKNLGACLDDAEPEAFIGVPKAHAARVLLGWARNSVRTLVTVGRRWFWGGHTLGALRELGATAGAAPGAPSVPGDGRAGTEVLAHAGHAAPAAILFTSGSTGAPKGAVYTQANFIAQLEALREVYGIRPGEVDLATFPLFALFGPALGMTSIIPDMDASRPAQADPHKLLAAIRDWKATSLFGSPALLERLGRYGEAHGEKLPSLRRAIAAGAPVGRKNLERFAGLLAPGAQVFTPYGATEALPIASLGSDEILKETGALAAQGKGVCVGRPVNGVRLAIIRITDEPIPIWSAELLQPAGEIGEIAVQGPLVTRSYYGRPDATALAKIREPAGDAFWHRMGDVGYLDAAGRLWMCGRKSHRVVTPAATLYTVPCEGVFNVHPMVFRSALVGVGPSGAQRAVLCVEREQFSRAGGGADEDLARELLEMARSQPMTQSIERVLFHPGFPVDVRHNAKISREQLAAWAAGVCCR